VQTVAPEAAGLQSGHHPVPCLDDMLLNLVPTSFRRGGHSGDGRRLPLLGDVHLAVQTVAPEAAGLECAHRRRVRAGRDVADLRRLYGQRGPGEHREQRKVGHGLLLFCIRKNFSYHFPIHSVEIMLLLVHSLAYSFLWGRGGDCARARKFLR
jgi:hypothetical protein